MTTAPQGASKPDLDAQIRDAEQRVIAADRDWQTHTEALGVAVRSHAGRAATFGGLGVAAALAGGLLLRWRFASRSKARELLLAKALAKVRWPAAARKVAAAAAAPAPSRAVRSSAALTTLIATVGTLIGAATRVGLKLPAKSGAASIAMRVLLPMATRWWRSRAVARPVPPAPSRPMAPPTTLPARPPRDPQL